LERAKKIGIEELGPSLKMKVIRTSSRAIENVHNDVPVCRQGTYPPVMAQPSHVEKNIKERGNKSREGREAQIPGP